MSPRLPAAAGSPAVLGLVGTALVAAGALAASVLLPQPVAGPAAADVTTRDVAVTTQSFDAARRVTVIPRTAEPRDLTVTDTGRVTASACAPGAHLTSGTSPLTLDDRPVVALSTAVPLWRDLDLGATGADVRALQDELVRLGHELRPDGVYRERTRAAVRALLTSLGAVRPSGALPVASVLWLPAPDVVATTCAARVGDPLTDGVVATVDGGLTALEVTEPRGDGFVLRYGQHAAPVADDGTVTDPGFLAAVAAGPELRSGPQDGEPATLELEEALAEPVDVAVVPPAAVRASDERSGCVLADGVPRPVTIVSSALGQALVTFDGAPSAVVTAPVPAGTSCT
ncbi:MULTISPECIES: peptidoglycan-binding domain-containing protein [Cellulomonas]|uniref:peptidoglycan-binding domain-containing protein n=1 Tax=Cellulomonas TaxID=1707 RepID=UPI0010A8EC91|nr:MULTISPECIES: peptidoglycan-binding domain-containing protein [Cellulomonas]